MKKLNGFLGAFLVLGASLLAGQTGGKGSLVIMGGAIHSSLDRVYQRFIELGGGSKSIRLAIIPAASAGPAVSGRENAADFVRLGVPTDHIRVFPVAVLDDPSSTDVDEAQWIRNGFNEELAKDMLEFTAVYFVGGDQIRYTQTLKGADGQDSPLLRSIRRIYANGGVIGGSSAGAAMMCDPMICDGYSLKALISGAAAKADSCPEANGVSLSTGLGFFRGGMVDQHFLKRGRVGRLLMAISSLPEIWLGVGIDEDTAAVCCGETIEVLGSSGVLIIDTFAARAAGHFTWSTAGGLKAKDIVLHYLEEGDRYNVATRTPLPRPERRPVEKGKEANADYPLETNLFAPDAFRNMLIDGMAENQKEETSGIAFTLDGEGRGIGSQWTLRKTARFAGLYAGIKDIDTYSVTYVSLDIQPVSLQLEKIR